MPLSRFLTGLALLAAALFALAYFDDAQYASSDERLYFSVGSAVGGLGGGLIWGVIVWGAVQLFRKRERTPSIRTVSLIVSSIIVAGYSVMEIADRFTITSDERLAVRAGIQRGCLRTQRVAVENSGVSEAELAAYCQCMAEEISAQITTADMQFFAANGSTPPRIEEIAQEVAPACADRTIGDGGP